MVLLSLHTLAVVIFHISTPCLPWPLSRTVEEIITLAGQGVPFWTKEPKLAVLARRVDRCFPLVSEPGPVPDADMTGDQDVPSLTAPTEQDTQATSSSEAGDWECQGRPTFKLVLVGDSGTEIISGDELAALAEARLLASGSQAQEEAAGQEADKEGDYVMCDSSDDEDEGICADISKGVSQDDDPSSFPPHVNSGGAAQQGSSAELLIEDSASDGEVQPGLAEETVVTHRDILLRAVKQRKRNIAEGDIGTHCMSASRKVNTHFQLLLLCWYRCDAQKYINRKTAGRDWPCNFTAPACAHTSLLCITRLCIAMYLYWWMHTVQTTPLPNPEQLIPGAPTPFVIYTH